MADNETQQIPDDLVYPKGEAPDDLVYPEGEGPTEKQTTTWGDVARQAVSNAPSSALQFGKDIAQPFIHPIDTARSIKNVGLGAMEKAGIVSGTEHEQYANAVGQFFKDRYGSMEGFKHALASDPVGVLGDASMVLTGGGSAAARAPGIAGRVGEIAAAAGRYTNPLTPAAAVVGRTAQGLGHVASEAVGLQTGTGGLALKTAAEAGYEGGEAAKDFRDHLRGRAAMSDPVEDARSAVGEIRNQRGQEYRDSMAKLGQDTTPLDFKDIDNAFARASGVRQFKGVDISPTTAALREKLGDTLTKWRNLDPAEYHTAEGLDALKKTIGDIRDGTAEYTPERVMANEVYNGIKKTIIKQAPEYGKIMQGYEDASNQIKELEKTLSLGNAVTTDTALRKLQSILRDNVHTNYGQRRTLAEYLVQNGAPTLMQKLAGQALSPIAPRGLGRFALQVGGEMAAIVGGSVLLHPAFAAMAPMMSPRVMGETAYLAGRAASPLKYIPGGTATTARGLDSYLDASRRPAIAGEQQQDQQPPPTKAADVRGALPVAGSELGQSSVSGAGSTMKGAAILTTGVGGSREDISKHYDNYTRFGSMSPQEQQAALAALHGDTNISINERRRLEKMMLERRGSAMPPGVPPGSRAQRSASSGLVRWVAPDGSIYSPSGVLAH